MGQQIECLTMVSRNDNRAPDQMRPLRITPNYIAMAEGSALIELGHTKVICTASVDETVPSFLRNSGKGWVTSEYAMIPRSTLTRTPRESVKGRLGGRTHEIQRLIGRSLRAVTDLKLLGERSILVDCDVIQADGGTRTASITGGFLALGIAVARLLEAGTLKKSPLREFLAATSVGVVDGQVMLDLAYEEDARAEVDMNVVMTGSGKFVELQATAEQHPFEETQLKKMMEFARAGIAQLVKAQRELLPQL